MSVVGGTMQDDVEEQSPSFLSGHPWVLLIGVGVVALILLRIFLGVKQNAAPPTAAKNAPGGSGTTGDTSGLSTDANGNPILYVPTQDTFLNYNYASNSYNSSTTTTNTTNNGTDTDTHPGGPPPTPAPTPPPKVTPPPTQTKGSWTCRYTVVSGDTLSGIAERYGTNWPAVYGHNVATVNAIAGAMHFIIPGGAWNNIRPGEVLIVPCK